MFHGKPSNRESFECRVCQSTFQSERGIVCHFKSRHPGMKPLVCPQCGMELANKLKEHLKTHGIGEEFVCELCSKRFNQKFMSKIHELWHEGLCFILHCEPFQLFMVTKITWMCFRYWVQMYKLQTEVFEWRENDSACGGSEMQKSWEPDVVALWHLWKSISISFWP